jgi:hypothetical protein
VRLPAVSDAAALNVVATLDELLLPWHDRGGQLLTMLPLLDAQGQYLRQLGLDVRTASLYESVEAWADAGRPRCAYQVAGEQLACWQGALPALALAPYSVTSSFRDLARRLGQEAGWPDPQVVALVNSKVFSTELNLRFAPDAAAHPVAVVRTLAELDHFVAALGGRAFIVKEPFGVSGKGHFLVQDDAGWARLRKLLVREILGGARLELVVKALAPKTADFSSTWEIAADPEHGGDGAITLCGLQTMLNDQFRYSASAPAGPALRERLAELRYQEVLRPYLEAVRDAGYWGPVGIDSMLLAGGGLRAVVEINARDSMGSIAQALNAFLAAHGTAARVTSLDLSAQSGRAGGAEHGALMAALDDAGLLWRPGRQEGVLPLSSASLYVNRRLDGPARARWYVALVGVSPEAQAAVDGRLTAFCGRWPGWRLH